MIKNNFFSDNVLLHSQTAESLYETIRSLPIVDYHSHIDEREIAENKTFSTITEFWLKRDHYKWRVMRSCGVEEKLITGNASDYDKFLAYATIMPALIGNPLYYWTHMELKQIFGIDTPLNAETAPLIYDKANKILKTLTVQKLLRQFNVEYIATTDDPTSALEYHGTYDGVRVCPTFRADSALRLDEDYLKKMSQACGQSIVTLKDYKQALESRLNFFICKGCTIADISVESIPDSFVSEEEAESLFARRTELTTAEQHRFFSYGMAYLGELFKRYGIVWQLHIGALRNINSQAYATLGVDAGYDVMHGHIDTDAVATFINFLHETGKLPRLILYALNANAIPALCTIAGSFTDVRVGAAWWFNDTLNGVRNHLKTLQEYSVFGASLGMITDSRCFSSYCRFDFFRRILANLVADKINAGEYDENSANNLLADICYNNPKKYINL